MSAMLTAAPPKRYTPDDLLQMADAGKGYELVDGKLVELNVSSLSSLVAGEIFGRIRDYVKARKLGWVFPEGTSFQCFRDKPNKVRRADASFIRLDRLTAEQVAAEGHCTVVPDLVVEVVSPNDLADKVTENRLEWQRAGAQLVWIVHPVEQIVDAYRGDGAVAQYQAVDTLAAEPVLPGFQAVVGELFQMPAGAK